jgi:hypothetical protein
MAAETQTQVVVYQVDPSSGETGERVGTGSLVDSQFVLIHPPLSSPLSQQLATQPDAPNLRLGIASLANDVSTIEVIDVREIIDVYEHDGTSVVALELARPSAAPFDPVFPDGGVPSENEKLVQAVSTYLKKATPPEDADASTGPRGDLKGPPPPVFFSWFCRLHPRDPRCRR